ncbi:MAG: T9SS type A sorting domain-containing protein [Bacteroidota bacterium]
MNIIYKVSILALFIFGWGTGIPQARAQLCNWLQVQVGQAQVGTTVSVFLQPNLDVNTLPCMIWSLGSQITMRWPAVAGNNPITALTFNGVEMGFTQNTGLGVGGAVGTDGGDGFYYAQFTNSGSGNLPLSAAGAQEVFNFTYTATSTPIFEFVPTGTTTIFGNTDPAIFMGGQNVFDAFIPNGAFPVEWTHFAARAVNGRSVELAWGTALEINNDYFQIEKSIDGQVFEQIARVEGAGTSGEKREYFYVDQKYVADKIYYRLKQVDKDGAFEYSKIEEVRLENSLLSELRFEISPNPALDEVQIKLLDKAIGSYHILIVDAYGKEVNRAAFDLENGLFSMEVTGLSEGLYFASLIGENGNQYSIGKFLKR